jgi:hypothetical protein
MATLAELKEKTRQAICKKQGKITHADLFTLLYPECKENGYLTKETFFTNIAQQLYKEYALSKEKVLDSLRSDLSETDGEVDKYKLTQMYEVEFKNLCIDEEIFYKEYVAEAYNTYPRKSKESSIDVLSPEESDTISEGETNAQGTGDEDNSKTKAAESVLSNKEISFKKTLPIFIVYSLLFFLTLFVFFRELNKITIFITTAALGITFITAVISLLSPRSLNDTSHSKAFNFIHRSILLTVPFSALGYAICSEAIKSQSSVYKPLYRSILKKNTTDIKNNEIIVQAQKNMYLLDISKSMEGTTLLKSWHTDIINALQDSQWRKAGDTSLFNELKRWGMQKKLSTLQVSTLKLCKEITDCFKIFDENKKDSSYFTFSAFSNVVNTKQNWISYKLSNIKEALLNIICDKYKKYANNLTRFTEVFTYIDHQTKQLPIRSIYTPNTFSVTIISDFFHDIDTANIEKDTTLLKDKIDIIDNRDITLKLLTADPTTDTLNTLNVKNLIERQMSNSYIMQKISKEPSANSLTKSESTIVLLHDDASHIKSTCKIHNIFPEKKKYGFQLSGNIANDQEYFLIDEDNEKHPLSDKKMTEIEFKKILYLSYTGHAETNQKPEHKLIISDSKLGLSIEYNIVFQKSLNKAKALIFLGFVFFAGYFTLLFWLCHYLWHKKGNIDLIFRNPI